MSVTLRNPYLDAPDAIWLTGNFHTHTTRSDGVIAPQDIVRAYAALGHQFLAISDHNTPVDFSGLDPCGLVLVPASEINGSYAHVLALGVTASVERDLDQQQTIDAIRRGGGLAILCHPSWEEDFDHYTIEQMLALDRFTGIEIFNGSIVEDPGNPVATDKWDRLLAENRVVWGLATDDAHAPRHIGRGACVVRVRERTPEAILAAIRSGSFYATTGQTIDRIAVDGSVLRVTAPGAQCLSVVGPSGRRLAHCEGTTIEYNTADFHGAYIRVECLGPLGRMAWTQPFFIEGSEVLKRQALLSDRPVLQPARLPHAPRLTGDLADPLWQKAASTSAFVRNSDGAPPPVRTELLAFIAENRLFLGIRADEPVMDQIKMNVRQNGLSSTWTDDCMELFVDVENQARRYFHIMINPRGCAYSREQGAIDGAPRRLNLETAAARSSTGYTLELAIPLADLGAESDDAIRWGFNAVRHRTPQQPDYFAWSFTGGTNHAPKYFGLLIA